MDDDRWRDLLRSPLDDGDEPQRAGWRWFFVGLLVVASFVGVGALLGRGDDGSPGTTGGAAAGTPAPGATTSPTTTRAGVVGYPPAALFGAMEYDPASGRMILFGGDAAVGLVGETWVLDADAGEWRRLSPSQAPSPRVAPGTAFDAERGRLVLFGGAGERLVFCSPVPVCSGRPLGDTWLFDPEAGAWEELPGPGPPPRVGHAMAYDPAADKVVLYGGAVLTGTRRGTALGDTWVFDPATGRWSQAQPSVSPPEKAFAAMASDPVGGRLLLWGGSTPGEDDDGLWAFDAAGGEWAQVPDGEAPIPRWFHNLLTVPDRDGLLLLGGNGAFTEDLGEGITATRNRATDELWLFAGADRAWTPLPPTGQPMTQVAAAYHPALRQAIV